MTALTAAYIPPANRPEYGERECILDLLDAFARQRPGLEFGNGDYIPDVSWHIPMVLHSS